MKEVYTPELFWGVPIDVHTAKTEFFPALSRADGERFLSNWDFLNSVIHRADLIARANFEITANWTSLLDQYQRCRKKRCGCITMKSRAYYKRVCEDMIRDAVLKMHDRSLLSYTELEKLPGFPLYFHDVECKFPRLY